MRYDENGKSLWFGTSDAPGPQGEVAASSAGRVTGLTVTVGVQPMGPRNAADVRYQVNGGTTVKVVASLARTDVRANAQYFVAALPAFRVGDSVNYNAVATWPGGQLPSGSDAATYPASFTVVANGGQSSPSPTSNPGPAAGNPALTPNGPAATGATAGKGPDRVNGYVFFEYGLPGTGVHVRLYNRGFGNAATKLGEITTDVNGYYSIAYDVKGGHASLELRAVDAHGKEVALCDVKHGVQAKETLNLVAPTSLRPVDPEFHRLSADIGKELGGFEKVAAAREDEDQRDLTLLSHTTGWDARLVALAATASQLSAESKIAPDLFYGLFRAGLPPDKHQLARTHVEDVEAALKAARDADIIKLDDRALAAAKDALQKHFLSTLHDAKASGAVSTFAEMLAMAGLTPAQQTAFAQIFFAQGSSAEGLWEKVEALGIPKDKIAALQLQGKLLHLTLNNAPLAAELQKEVGSPNNLPKLIDADLHEPEQWKARLNKLAGNNEKALAALIPSTYGAEAIAERLDAYAADLARRVRMSYPTHVVARMLEAGHLPFDGQQHGSAASAAKFLKTAADQGFEMGRTPVETFLAANKQKLLANMTAGDLDAAVQDVKHLHRLHQITPSDESLKSLFASGLKSAHDVARLPYDAFMARHGHAFPSLNEADLVYRKAQQVTSTTMNFCSMVKKLSQSPSLFTTSPPPHIREASKQNLIKTFPTMQSLFGSLDFCQCEECGSILGPAAYLVDLLQFIDPHPADWRTFLAQWQAEHNNTPYPLQDTQTHAHGTRLKLLTHGRSAAATPKTPYEVFVERRPDIPHLPLTCENTNTVMPYIDIVNEVLEYFVVHDALASNSGYDTGKTASEELIAEPQNLLPAAYDKLRQAKYPLTLPFDLWVETVRRFLHHFELRLPEILECFRHSDDIFAAAPAPYGWSDIFVESLGLSPAEYGLFTDPSVLTRWFAMYGYASEHEAMNALSSAATLAQSVSISYLELASIVTTGFVNPGLEAMVLLRNYELEVEEVFRYKKAHGYPAFSRAEEQTFHQRLAGRAGAFQTSEEKLKASLDQAWQAGGFDRILVLADSAATCNFDQTVLQYANGAPADAGVLLRINLFVRLWKKLRWNIEELDRALNTLLPKSYRPLTVATIGPAFKAGLLYLAHLEHLNQTLKLGRDGRMKLLTLWSDLPTTGKNPLYAQLFLKRSILKTDAIFDDPAGNYLSDPSLLLMDHSIAIQGALNLTAQEVVDIISDAGLNPATAPLSLANVSLLYRYGLLAKALKISVEDLIALKALSGLNPFQALRADSLSVLADDYPFSQTIRFVEVAHIVKESGFHIQDLDYLCRHQFDPVGKYKEDPSALAAFAKTIAAGLRSILTEQAIPSDASTLTDDLLQQKLSLVLSSAAVTTFMGMWNGTIQYNVVQPNVPPGGQLDPAAFAAIPAIHVTYDPVLQAQRLTYSGFLTDTQVAALQRSNPSPLLANLLSQVTASATDYYNKYLSPFLSVQDFKSLFAPIAPGADAQTFMLQKRASLANQLFPYIQRQLSRQFVIQGLAAALSADASLMQTLLSDPTLLNDPNQPLAPLTDAFFPLAQNQVDIGSFASTDGSGAPLPSSATSPPNSVHYDGYFEVAATGPYRFFVQIAKSGGSAKLCLDLLPNPLIQASAPNDQAELSGVTNLKAGVPYGFTFDGSNLGGGSITLLIQGETLPKGPLAQLTLYSRSAVVRAGRNRILVAKVFQFIDKLPLDERELRYLLTNAGDFGGLSFSALPAASAEASPANAALLFQQFLRLAGYARIRSETAGGGDDVIGIFENAQRTFAAATDPNQAQTTLLTDLCDRLAKLTRRDAATICSAIQQLRFTALSTVSSSLLTVTMPELRQEIGLQKLWRVLQIAHKAGVPADVVARWATPAPDSKVAADLRSSVKARYEPQSWLAIAPSIFDKLRQSQRDALVAYITFRRGFADKDELFDYFLLDPAMEPVVQTSRLRLAISCLQTFIQRCLLNLEPEVQPSALSSDEWQWMKRYRVWQANREIFLFPENWLDPEFRDDKTDLFQELEGTLLQGDITNDLAEGALFTYLKKLEAIARLEIVTMCCEEDPLDPDANRLHVIGRSHTQPHNYFYRTFAQEMWTAWQEISTTIDGDHVVAAIWHSRLSVFWLTFIEQAPPDSNSSSDSSSQDEGGQKLSDMKMSDLHKATHTSAPPKVIQVQLNWIEYFQGQWTTPSSSGGSDESGGDSDGNGSSGSVGNPLNVTVPANFDRSSVSIHATVEEENGVEVAKIHVYFPQVEVPRPHGIKRLQARSRKGPRRRPGAPRSEWAPSSLAFKLVSKYFPPEIVAGREPSPPPFPYSSYGTTHWKGTNPFQVHYLEKIQSVNNQPPKKTFTTQSILEHNGEGAGSGHQLTVLGMPLHPETPEVGVLVSPFFFADNQNTFFVEPSLTETKIHLWEHWAIPIPKAVARRALSKEPRIAASFPRYNPPHSLPAGVAAFSGRFDPGARFHVQIPHDAVTDERSTLQYGEHDVGSGGGTGEVNARQPVARPAPKSRAATGAHR
jgi:Neuraminidase-like domain/Salmonella virulence plasmid 28.1kDa A protein